MQEPDHAGKVGAGWCLHTPRGSCTQAAALTPCPLHTPTPTFPPPAQLEGENFCKPCFKKVFMLRGKYSDVAGGAKKEAKEAAAEGGAAVEAAPPTAAAAAVPAAAASAASAATAVPVKPGAWVPKAPAEGSAGDSKYGGGKKCAVCTKSVYTAEPKVEADGKIWHASCFKCEECKSQITLEKWAQLEGKNFCKMCAARATPAPRSCWPCTPRPYLTFFTHPNTPIPPAVSPARAPQLLHQDLFSARALRRCKDGRARAKAGWRGRGRVLCPRRRPRC